MKLPNQWHVITGAPCSGKTSVICEIEKRGYGTVPEAARAYINQELAKGLTLDKIKENELDFESHILHLKAATEISLPSNKILFFDRAIPDSIAYFKLVGLDPSEAIALSSQTVYKKVFLLDRLQFEKDSVRVENDLIAEKLEVLLYECYRKLGYAVVRIPMASIEKRTDVILEAVSTH